MTRSWPWVRRQYWEVFVIPRTVSFFWSLSKGTADRHCHYEFHGRHGEQTSGLNSTDAG